MATVETPERLGELVFPSPDGSSDNYIGDIQVPNGEIWYVDQIVYVSEQQGTNASDNSDYQITTAVAYQDSADGTRIETGFGTVAAAARLSKESRDFGTSLEAGRGGVVRRNNLGEYLYGTERIAFYEQTDAEATSGQLKAVIIGRRSQG